MAALNERPSRLASYHNGRGYDPVIAVGSTMSRVVFSIVLPPSILATVSDASNPCEEEQR